MTQLSESCRMILSEKDISQTDILHGKGSKCVRHIGTMAFKALVGANLSTYMDEATESCDKTYMTVEIVENILAQGGRFLRETKTGSSSGQSWVEMDKMKAREKVRSAFGNAAKCKRQQRPPTGAVLLAMQEYSSSQEFDTESSFIDIVNTLKKQDAIAPKHPTKTRTTSLKASSSKRGSEPQLTKKSVEPPALVLHQNITKAAKFPQPWIAPAAADHYKTVQQQHLFASPPVFDRCRPILIPVPPPSSSIALLPRPTLIPSVAMVIASEPTKVSTPPVQEQHKERHCLNAADIRPTDILIGKSKQCNYHLGTIAFKLLISLNLAVYMDPETASCEKSFMNVQLVDGIYSEGGRFLHESKHGSGVWLEINKHVAREKVRQGFRDAGSAQKNQRPGTLLSKIKFSSNFETGNSFSDIMDVISRDPAVLQSLSSATSGKARPRAPPNNVVRILKIAPKRTSHPGL